MLKKILQIKLKVIGVVILILGIAQIISAYFFGVIAEKQLDVQFKRITATAVIHVLKRDYKRGWFSANETVELALNDQLLRNMTNLLPGMDKESVTRTNAYTLRYTTHITHGLFAGWLNGDLFPTIAYARTEIQFPARLAKILNKFFNNQQAIIIDNVIYLNKAGKFFVDSPKFNYDEAVSGVKVVWGGLKLRIGYNPVFDQFDSHLTVPLFDLDAPTKSHINLTDLSYTARSATSENNIRVGSAALKLTNLTLALGASNKVQIKFGEAVHLLTGVNSADFLNGIDAIDPTNFTINNISYSSVSNESSAYFNARVLAGFARLSSNKHQYGPMDFDFSLNHVAAAQFSRLSDELGKSASSDQTNADSRDKVINLLKTQMVPIFAQQPQLKLNHFSLVTPSGPLTLTGQATTTGFTAADMNDQTKFMSRLKVAVQFSVPKPILAYFFLLQMKYFLTAGNAQMDQQSSDALAKVVNILLDNQLQVWLKKGYLQESQNLLVSEVKLESGVVSLNGVSVK